MLIWPLTAQLIESFELVAKFVISPYHVFVNTSDGPFLIACALNFGTWIRTLTAGRLEKNASLVHPILTLMLVHHNNALLCGDVVYNITSSSLSPLFFF